MDAVKGGRGGHVKKPILECVMPHWALENYLDLKKARGSEDFKIKSKETKREGLNTHTKCNILCLNINYTLREKND